ncbi:MAG TPA: iron-sulfur cluster biosynthesis family protein [Bacillaceae bacterium]|nr:iron-sulfur cluster biosynthesis family protein [Paenibacillus bovis]HLU22393.1 iron-sulfur cluster biosynthesis family protein [Bacillaceae bacterium]
MKLTITDEAVNQIEAKKQNQDLVVKLKYETDGCGCAVSGVPTLQLMKQQALDQEDIALKTNAMDVYIEKSKEIFFADELKLDYSVQTGLFRLVSPGEILNGRMSCTIQ